MSAPRDPRTEPSAMHEDSRLLDFFNHHPRAVSWAEGYRGDGGSWVWTDKQHTVRQATDLRDALRKAKESHGGVW